MAHFRRQINSFIRTFLLLLNVAPAFAQTPAEAIEQAQKKLTAYDLNGAWEVLSKAAGRSPDSVELPVMLGLTDYLRGELADAEMEFKKAVRMNDKFGRAWLGLGRVFEAAS